jgi:signal transduction histidine kinase
MMKPGEVGSGADHLRAAAESTLSERSSGGHAQVVPLSSPEALLHELQVHQIELEMRNESLLETQADLERSRDQYFALFDLAPVGYLILDAAGRVLRLNQLGAQLLQAQPEAVHLRHFIELVTPGDQGRWQAFALQSMARMAAQSLELGLLLPDGAVRHVRLDSMRQAAAASDAGLRLTVTDMSERLRADLSQQQQNDRLEETVRSRTAELLVAKEAAEAGSRAKSEFLANMSHEVRTPMNAIVGFTYLLRHGNPTEEQRKWLDIITDAADHLMTILNDILDLATIEAGKMKMAQTCFDLPAVLGEVCSLIMAQAQTKGLSIALEQGAVPTWVRGDATRVRQALLNYMTNAVKFTERGSITLRAILQEVADDEILVRFEVQDTGIGVTPKLMSNLFQPFEQGESSTTRQYGGTGLGLAITRHLAALMGGEAGVLSRLGKGSTFWFTAAFGRANPGMDAKVRHPLASAPGCSE